MPTLDSHISLSSHIYRNQEREAFFNRPMSFLADGKEHASLLAINTES